MELKECITTHIIVKVNLECYVYCSEVVIPGMSEFLSLVQIIKWKLENKKNNSQNVTALKKKTKINKDVLDDNGIRLRETLPWKNLETKIKNSRRFPLWNGRWLVNGSSLLVKSKRKYSP